jgi:uncharacterized membrane protein YdjX (TVP38/TMEM64 family)
LKFFKSPKNLIAVGLVFIIAFVLWKYPVEQGLLSLVEWIKGQGVFGYIVYILVYIVAAVIFFPGSIITLGAGFAWGLFVGSILVSIASLLGATVAFLVGRYIARDWVAKKIANNESFKRIDRAVAGKGFKIVLLTRLSPIIPFTLQNYGYGLTGVSLKDYFFASWIGMIPGTIMYVYIGSLITEITQIASGQTTVVPGQKIFYFIGLAVTLAVSVYVASVAKKALAEGVEDE